ncbi:hypothetical protein FC694_22505 [Bacillus wiedmannii]|uniref:Uncharacterized protein n=1 Tax=Bacillus wiedmannii TaxID=1890302 RepID=A0A4U2MM58_9BACI|nr:hypothetical protein [Bacillus wiedmannii]TKH12189.1 hypothetical protein FC694_22505 [Bacillus wiedmannii]
MLKETNETLYETLKEYSLRKGYEFDMYEDCSFCDSNGTKPTALFDHKEFKKTLIICIDCYHGFTWDN